MGPPTVSVITPTYNRATLIGQTVQSVLNQAFSDFELIIVDDGSTDHTEAVVQQYRDKRICFIHQEHTGIGSARNAGINNARGRYIAFLDSDDLWLPSLLETQVPILEYKPLIGLVYAQAQAMDIDGKPRPQRLGAPLRYPEDPFKSMLYGYTCCTPTTLVRRECFERAGMFDETLSGRIDYDMFLRIARYFRFFFVEKVLARFRFHSGRTTGRESPIHIRAFLDRITIIDKAFSETGLPPEALAIKPLAYRNAYLDISMHWLNLGCSRLALRSFGKAVTASGRFTSTTLRFLYLVFLYKIVSRSFLGNRLLFEAVKRYRRSFMKKDILPAARRTSVPEALPTFAIVSVDIRRDLVHPTRHFTRFRVVHLYRKAPYEDMTEEDYKESLVKYTSSFRLLRLLIREHPDIVQGLELFSIRQVPYQMALFIYALARGIPMVTSVHVTRPLSQKYGELLALLFKAFLRPQLRFIRLFFYLNKGCLENLKWAGAPSERLIRLMYGTWGVDLDEFSPVQKGTGSPYVLLFVGRIDVEKGIFVLLHAFGLVKELCPSVNLVVVGDGPQRNRAEMIAKRRGWQKDVQFAGTVKNRDLPHYYRRASMFVSPSITTRKWAECVGMTNLQAMACGIPVISTASGGIPEYLPEEEAGILVPEGDSRAVARAIIRLLSDANLRSNMGEAGRAYAVSHYNAHDTVKRAEGFLLKIIRNDRLY